MSDAHVLRLGRPDAVHGGQHGYNPIGYHLGTVWPHDNSIIALGLARYGFRDEANRIALALLEAASFSDYRLPEAFSGYRRDSAPFPVPYPTACSPQAWATGAPLLFLRTMLGLRPRGRPGRRRTLTCPTRSGASRSAASTRSAPAGSWRRMGTKASVRLSKEQAVPSALTAGYGVSHP